MNYKAFFDDVLAWINEANQMAEQHGLHSNDFWTWVTKSEGHMCEKYNNNPLVIQQMIMLHRWLEDMYNQSKGG